MLAHKIFVIFYKTELFSEQRQAKKKVQFYFKKLKNKMIQFEPDIQDRYRYKHGAAAEVLQINRKTLLAYRNEGKIKASFDGNHRIFYWGKDIKIFWQKYFF